MLKEQCNMQDNAIQLSGNPQEVSWSDVRESLIAKYNRVNSWLDSVSPFFSGISQMQVTRRVVLHIYALMLCLVVLVLCLFQAFAVSVIAAIASVWLTVRINQFAKVNKMIGEDSYGRE